MIGAGKYDGLCTHVREQAEAAGAIVIVIAGTQGDGFSAQFTSREMAAILAATLRRAADQIERDADQQTAMGEGS